MKDYPIELLNLSVLTHNCLKRANIKYISDVKGRSKKDLLKYRSFGEGMYNELQEKLNSFDYNFDMQKLIYDEYQSLTNHPDFQFFKARLYGEKYSSIAKKNNVSATLITSKITKLRKKIINYIIKTGLMDYYDKSKKELKIELEDSDWLVVFIEEIVASYGQSFLVR